MTLTKYGIREWGLALIIGALLLAGCGAMIKYEWHPVAGWVIGAVILLVLAAFCGFFRNPARKIPADPEMVVSPADGVVKDIEILDEFELFQEKIKVVRIGIFLSVLNVHVNRAPVDMAVDNINYREGEFLDARHPECGKRNEAMTISGRGKIRDRVFPVAVRQISGAIARRIVCPVAVGTRLPKGYIYGMIKFGSRTELYLPAEGFRVKVKIGDKVRGGVTILAVAGE